MYGMCQGEKTRKSVEIVYLSYETCNNGMNITYVFAFNIWRKVEICTTVKK